MGLLSWIVVGLISGWLASVVMKGHGSGLLGDIVFGVIGALVGGFLASTLLHVADPVSGFNLMTIVVSFVGALIVIFVVRLLRGGGRAMV
jgi:uncharacterized membrane protein YeaQ/YmgE (transglycosylase-associated protein family)